MLWRKKKVLNSKIAEFEADLKQRGLLLSHGINYRSSILMYDSTEFLQFAKRSSAGTIFKEECEGFENINYFYIADGVIVRIFFPKKVNE